MYKRSSVRRVGLVWCLDTESTKQKQQDLQSVLNHDLGLQLKDSTVRVVQPGGKEELYDHPIPAFQVMQKYPGTCVATAEVFDDPHESVLSAQDYLLPGEKYLIMPSKSVRKVQHRHQLERNSRGFDKDKVTLWSLNHNSDVCAESMEDYICRAKDFYVSREKWCNCLHRRSLLQNKPFVPPIQKPKWREVKWEPRLHSIPEISP